MIRISYNSYLDTYRIFENGINIADAFTKEHAQRIADALCNFTLANSSAESKPAPTPSTHGNEQPYTLDVTARQP